MSPPGDEQISLVLSEQCLDPPELASTESVIARERYRSEPELRGPLVAIDMNVRQLVRLVAVEIYPVRPGPQNCRHALSGTYLIRHSGCGDQCRRNRTFPGVMRPAMYENDQNERRARTDQLRACRNILRVSCSTRSSDHSGCCARRNAALCRRRVQYHWCAARQRCSGVMRRRISSCSELGCSPGGVDDSAAIVTQQ